MKIRVLSARDVHELLPYGECADVMRRALADLAPGRVGDHEITLFESLGLAAEDLAAASYLCEKATRLGLGTPAEF